MEINSVHKIYQIHPIGNAAQKVGNIKENMSVSKETTTSDSINISSQASFNAKIDVETKRFSVASTQTEHRSSGKVENLKFKYQGDNCPISSMDVAGAILNRVWGEYR